MALCTRSRCTSLISGPSFHVLPVRVADPDAPGPLDDGVPVPVGHRPVHDVPAGADAGLPLELERGPGTARARRLDVGVVEDHESVVPAQFQARALEVLGGDARDQPADLVRAGEVDHRDVRVLGQRLPSRRPFAGDQVEHPGRYAGLVEDLGEQLPATDRGQLGRLHHDRVAERERRSQRPQAEHHGEVPWRDDRDDAERDALQQRELAGLEGGQDVASATAGKRRGLVELAPCRGHLALRLGAHGTGLAHEDVDHLVGAPVEEVGRVAQYPRPLVGQRGGPAGLGPYRGGHRPVHVGGRADRVAAQLRAGRLLQHGSGPPVGRVDELARDVVPAVRDSLL